MWCVRISDGMMRDLSRAGELGCVELLGNVNFAREIFGVVVRV